MPPNLVQLIIQGGSFGLLAYGIIFLAPKGLRMLFEAHTKTVDAFHESIRASQVTTDKVIAEFRMEVDAVRQRADARSERMINALRQELRQLHNNNQ